MTRHLLLAAWILAIGQAFSTRPLSMARPSPRAARTTPTCSIDFLKVKNQQFAAGATGFVLGTFYGGPLAGILVSAGCNQGSKSEGPVGDLMLNLGELSIKV